LSCEEPETTLQAKEELSKDKGSSNIGLQQIGNWLRRDEPPAIASGATTTTMEDIAQTQLRGRTQAEERFARWMQRRERNLESVAVGTIGDQSSEGSTTK
jgi:hypothetical protein